jgi:hypothetical protein
LPDAPPPQIHDIRQYNFQARRFRWTPKSFEKVLAKAQVAALAA